MKPKVETGVELLHPHGIRDRQAVTATGTAGRQHLTATLGAHTLTEAMLVYFLSAGGLKCPFHR